MRTPANLLMTLVLVVSGCAVKNDYSAFYANPPRSILIVPVLNNTVEVLGPNMFVTGISQPVGERGYYVFPVCLTESLLRDLGLPEAGLVHQLPPGEFLKRFGADSVLFVTIVDWGSKYYGLQNSMKIEAKYLLVDTRTGSTLWERTQAVQKGSGGSSLIEMAVNAAVDKLMAEVFESTYRPLVQQLNLLVFTKERIGLPAGPYHPKHAKDRSDFPVKK